MVRTVITNILNILVLCSCASTILCHNKYSAEANLKNNAESATPPSLKILDMPFRMNKINQLWTKAQNRLSEPKLRSIYGELKLHDKEEVIWKQLRADGKDKEGLKEAELRRKFMTIMSNYGLLEQYTGKPPEKEESNDVHDKFYNKSLFKDKKLNKLWMKAESAGFSTAELQALMEEFNHHQAKIDEYYSVLSDVKDPATKDEDHHENSINDKLERFNTLEAHEVPESKPVDHLDRVNMLRDHHINLREGYERLNRLASMGPNSKDFVEPKVQGLWKVALESGFTAEELGSLQVELMHYEKRLLKLRHLQVEQALNQNHHKSNNVIGTKETGILLEDNIKKQARKVEKIHDDLETRIMKKREEL